MSACENKLIASYVNLEMDHEAYVCLVCNKRFEEELLLKYHLSNHCNAESLGFQSIVGIDELNNYELELPSKKTDEEIDSTTQLNCFCSTKFKENHVCSSCGKEFRRKDHLRKHYLVHSGKKPFSCLVCGKSFARKDRLKEHCVIHLANGWSCYFCGRMFAQRCILRKHEMIHRGIKPFSCDLCDKKFSRKNDLLRHGTSHSGEKTHFCEVCQKGFTQKRLLKRHLRTHVKEQAVSVKEMLAEYFT